MTAELQQTFELLQLSGADLLTAIRDELAANPLLQADENTLSAIEAGTRDADHPDEDRSDGEWLDTVEDAARADKAFLTGNDEEKAGNVLDQIYAPQSLSAHLEEQVRLLELPDSIRQKTFFLIGELNEDGFLEAPLEEIALWADSTRPPQEMADWNAALSTLHSLDPCGVGARSPQDALLIQIREEAKQKPAAQKEIYAVAERILTEALPELARKDYKKIRRIMSATEETVLAACKVIKGLSPRPASGFKTSPTLYTIPDILVHRSHGRWKAMLNPVTSPDVQVDEATRSSLSAHSGRLPKEWTVRLNAAQAFVRGLGQRYKTLLAVAEAIVARQQEFFATGDAGMRPMVLQDIAEATGLHESTISRTVNGKFLQCPLGIFELRHFFSSRVNSEDGEGVSSLIIRSRIRSLIAEEPPGKPYSDAKLAMLLSEAGIPVARRTVAKYREQEHLPAASLRKKGFTG